MAYWAVFKEHVFHYDGFPCHRKWPTSINRCPSTIDGRLVVGKPGLCIFSSRKACLAMEGNEKVKLTREVLSVWLV